MTLSQIKTAVDQGEAVYWSNKNYQVIKNKFGDYVIRMASNRHEIGLTWADGVTMNGAENEFFMEKGRN